MEPNKILDKVTDLIFLYGPKILIAAILLVGGFWLVRKLSRAFDHFLKARRVDESLRPFFTSLADMIFKITLILMVASTAGIETTSFIAIFSAIAFSIGLALQGSLGNFASGVLILLFRPFKVGDWLTVGEYMGKVVEIQIFSTLLITDTGKKIIIPNGKITEGPIQNIAEGVPLQAEITLLLNAKTPLDLLHEAVQAALPRIPMALQDREIEVKVRGISRDDMKTDISVWTLGEHHEETLNALYEALRDTLAERDIELAKERRRDLV